jgi:spoIIIJ-associated protein
MHDSLMHRGQQWLEELLRLAGLSARVSAEPHEIPGMSSEEDISGCWLKIDQTELTPDQIKGLIGQDGLVLDSIQYLSNVLLNLGQGPDQQCAYTIELDEYRVRRQTELRVMTEEAIEQVRQTGQEFEMQSLSSAERRLIHTILKECEDLESFSRGQEPDRRLVIRPFQVS